MVIVESYPLAVLMCVVTMLCWGSWANTQKLATREWRFQLVGEGFNHEADGARRCRARCREDL